MQEVNLLRQRAVSMSTRGEERVSGRFYMKRVELLVPTEQWPEMNRHKHSYASGVNSKYEFVLAKDVGKPDWQVRELKALGPSGKSRATVTERILASEALRHFLSMVAPVGVLVKKPDTCKIVSVTAVPGEQGLVRVAVDLRDLKTQVGPEGWWVLDPNACWCIREYHLSGAMDKEVRMTIAGTNEYTLTESGFPMPKRFRRTTIAEREGTRVIETELTQDFQSWMETDVPESVFSLSAFGLSEPGGASPQPRWYIWFFVVGACCLVLACATYWFVRRRAGEASIG
jgi:hypothetical protein